jgi:hypothetical protein
MLLELHWGGKLSFHSLWLGIQIWQLHRSVQAAKDRCGAMVPLSQRVLHVTDVRGCFA